MATQFQITTARRSDTRARIALCGPAGSGKSFTAIELARGLTDDHTKIVVIDSENRSAAKYADGKWKHLILQSFSIGTYVDAIQFASKQADVVIVDSLSHAWMGTDGALDQVNKATARSQSNNSYFAWRQVTPLHNQLVEALVQCVCHIIVTMRTKTAYVIVDVNGKQTPRKVGMAPIQRDGVEYEFDVVADIDIDHTLVVTKSRCPKFDGLVCRKPGSDIGRQLREWLSDVDPASPASPAAQAATAAPTAYKTEPKLKSVAERGAEAAKSAQEEVGGFLKLPPKQAWEEYLRPELKAEGVDSAEKLTPAVVDLVVARIKERHCPPDDDLGFDGVQEPGFAPIAHSHTLPSHAGIDDLDCRDSGAPPRPSIEAGDTSVLSTKMAEQMTEAKAGNACAICGERPAQAGYLICVECGDQRAKDRQRVATDSGHPSQNTCDAFDAAVVTQRCVRGLVSGDGQDKNPSRPSKETIKAGADAAEKLSEIGARHPHELLSEAYNQLFPDVRLVDLEPSHVEAALKHVFGILGNDPNRTAMRSVLLDVRPPHAHLEDEEDLPL